MHDHQAEQAEGKAAKPPAAGRREHVTGPPQVRAMLDAQKTVGNAAVVQRRMAVASEEQAAAEAQAAAVHDALSRQGKPFDPEFQAEAEARTGRNFSGRVVHDDAAAHEAATSVQAHAFATENHIVFGKGQYDTKSDKGKRVALEELIHTEQQAEGPVSGTVQPNGLKVSHPHDPDERAATSEVAEAMSKPYPVQRHAEAEAPSQPGTPHTTGMVQRAATTIQRDVGFEVEVSNATTLALSPPLKEAERTWDKQIVAPITSQTWVERRKDRAKWRPQVDPPSMARRLRKKEVLVDVPGLFTVEADDAFGGGSNLEFVTNHFPEGAAGRPQLAAAIAGMLRVAQLLDGSYRSAGELARVSQGTAQVPTDLPRGQTSAEYAALGFAGSGNPQMTAGIPLENLEGLFHAVQNAHEERNDPDDTVNAAAPDLAAHDSVPDGAGGRTGAIRSAKQGVDRVLNEFAFVDRPEGQEPVEVPASDNLRGLLLLVSAYLIDGAGKPRQAYYKGVAPVMARTDFATMFGLLDEEERNRLTAENGDPFVQLALRSANLTAPDAADGPVLESVDGDQPGSRVSFGEVTRQAWLRGITQGTDLLSSRGYAATFPDEGAKGESFESMGSLGARTDMVRGQPAPIVELRRMRKSLPAEDWPSVLLGVFDLITTIVEEQNNSPRYRRA